MPSLLIYQNTGGGAVPDIFVILLHHAHSINMTVWHRQIVNIQLSDVADSLGEDYQRRPTVPLPSANVSSFKDKGNVRPPKKLEKNTRFYKTFRQMGDDVKCQASGDETAGAVCIRIWCTDT